MEQADPSIFADGETGKNKILAQAHAIRGYYYLYLSQNFGRVPMLETGETYSNTPGKPRPETMDETYQLILDDFEFAATYLDWTPENGEYGRFTKGAALAYAAWTYMYMKDFETAKGLYEQIINSGTYQLLPSFGELYQMDHYWEKESIWGGVEYQALFLSDCIREEHEDYIVVEGCPSLVVRDFLKPLQNGEKVRVIE